MLHFYHRLRIRRFLSQHIYCQSQLTLISLISTNQLISVNQRVFLCSDRTPPTIFEFLVKFCIRKCQQTIVFRICARDLVQEQMVPDYVNRIYNQYNHQYMHRFCLCVLVSIISKPVRWSADQNIDTVLFTRQMIHQIT